MSNNQPHLSRVDNVSPIWIVPIIALFIAGWLAVKAWQDRGQEIQVIFDGAAGITVGKTEVKYRDVVIGRVNDIKLSSNFEKVTVYIEMDAQVQPLISVNSRFWVVAPRISLGGVSGLDTLLSGVYIEMDPGDPGAGRSLFDGLKEPPSVRSYQQGTQYILLADELGSLNIGSPIYYRQIPVGEVTRYRLLPDVGRVEIRVFVNAPHDNLVKTNTTFWNVSGIGFGFGADGFEAKIETVASLLSGGLAFNTPPDIDNEHETAKPGDEFYLFADKNAVAEGALTFSYPYLLQFNSSVRGLVADAPVEFKGIQVGKVDHVGLDYGIGTDREIDVVIAIQPERINPEEAPTLGELNKLFAKLVAEGMRAELKTRSFLTGSLYVDLVPSHSSPSKDSEQALVQHGDYLVIPSADNAYSKIARRVADIAKSVQDLPFDSIGKNLDESLRGVADLFKDLNEADLVNDMDKLMNGLNGSSDSLGGAIGSLQQTLQSLDQVIAPDSALQYRLNEMLEDVSGAAKSLESLTDELSRYPDALLRGRDKEE